MRSSFLRQATFSGMQLAGAHHFRSVAALFQHAHLRVVLSCTIRGCPCFPLKSLNKPDDTSCERGGFAANCRMINPTSRGEPHHSLTVAARGRVGRTRAAVGQLPSENGQTHAQSNSRTIVQRKLHSLILPARILIARANQRRRHRIARARGVSMDLHRPLKEAHNTRVCGTTLRFGHN
jgi:hypothetical protein